MNKQVEQLTEQLHYYLFRAPLCAETKARVKAIQEELERLRVPKPTLGLTLSQFQLLYNDITCWPYIEKAKVKRTSKYLTALGILLAVLLAGFINQHLYVSAIKHGYVRQVGDDTIIYGFFHRNQTVEVPASILDQSIPITIDTLGADNYMNLYLPWDLLRQNPESYQLSLLHTDDGYIITLHLKNLTVHIQKGLRLPWNLPEDAILQDVNSNWDNSDIYLSGNTIYAKFEIKRWMYYVTSTLTLDDFMDLINNFYPYNPPGGHDNLMDVTFNDVKNQRYKNLYLPVHLLDNPDKYDYRLGINEGVLNDLSVKYFVPDTERFFSLLVRNKFGMHRFEFIGDRVDWPETQPPYDYLRAMYNTTNQYFHVSFVTEAYFYLIISNYPEEELKELIRTMVLLD